MLTHSHPRPLMGAAVAAGLLATIMFSAAPATAASVTVSIHGTEIILPIPKGDCVLSDKNPADHERLSNVRRVNKGRNIVLALFADCKKLAASRKTDAQLNGIGSYLASVSAAKRRYKMSRERFTVLIAKQFTNKDTLAAMAKAQEEAKRRIKDIGQGTSLSKSVNLGMIHRDDTGVFTGVVQNWQNEGQAPTRFAVVLGLTMVRQKIITVQLSGRFEGQRTIDRLLAADRENVRRLIAANEK